MREKDFQLTVCEAAMALGYRLQYHTFDSRHSTAGFPDLVLIRESPPRIVYVEVKSERGHVSEAQAGWLRALWACGQEAYVVYPHLLDDLVMILREGTGHELPRGRWASEEPAGATQRR